LRCEAYAATTCKRRASTAAMPLENASSDPFAFHERIWSPGKRVANSLANASACKASAAEIPLRPYSKTTTSGFLPTSNLNSEKVIALDETLRRRRRQEIGRDA
jgi:hypothetical protein